jgi:transposase
VHTEPVTAAVPPAGALAPARIDISTGEVLAQCKRRHRHQGFLAFLQHIDRSVPAQLDVHLVIDNSATHKHAAVRAWLAARPGYHAHFTPAYASWLDQVERWFGHVTQRAIRRGSFRTVRELVRRIDAFVQHDNAGARPFAWTATADSILAKLQRLLQAISGTAHSRRVPVVHIRTASRTHFFPSPPSRRYVGG